MAGSIAFSGKAIIVKLAYRYGVDAVTLIMYRMLFALPLFAAARVVGRARQAGADAARLARSCTGLGFSGYYLASFLDFAGLAYITRQPRAADPVPQPDAGAALGCAALQAARPRAAARSRSRSATAACCWCSATRSRCRARNAALGAALVFASAVSYAVYLVCSGEEVQAPRRAAPDRPGDERRLPVLHRAVPACCGRCRGAGGRAAGDLAVGAQRDAVHLRAGADGDDGDRAHRRGDGGADGHGRAAVDDPDGRADPRRAVHRLDRRRHGAGARPGIWLAGASGGRKRDGSRNRRQVGAGLRREQGPRQGLRDGARRARASTSSITARGAEALEATAARAARARPRRGARRRRRHHDRRPAAPRRSPPARRSTSWSTTPAARRRAISATGTATPGSRRSTPTC